MKRRSSRPTRLAPLLAAVPAAASCASPPATMGGGPHDAENVVWIEHPAPPSTPTLPPAPERRRAEPPPRDGPEPHHFWYLSQGEVAERREWLRVDRSTWEERFPNGAVMRYRIVGRLREGARVGAIARRLPGGDLEVFVPDIGVEAWPAMRVSPDGDWHDLGPMHLID